MERNTLALLLLLACALPSIRCQTAELPETTEIVDSTESTDSTESPVSTDSTDSTESPDSTDTTDSTTDSSMTTTDPNYFCAAQTATEVDLKGLSGQWFEVARVPNEEDKQCVNYILPDSPNEENQLELQVEYVDAADGKWEGAIQSSSLPWDDNSKNGVFNWNIGEDNEEPVTFKLVSTDLTTYAFFCGYKGHEPEPLFKVWTRQRELNADQMQTIEDQFQQLELEMSLTWVEQSPEQCNSATRTPGAVLLSLVLAIFMGLTA